MPEIKRTIKDSLFTYLFRQPEYMRQLYLVLHPEDTFVTESDCRLITLENVLTVGLYNDLGIQVRNKLILLVEAQSIFTINITLRLLLYLAATYKEYIEEHKLDVYSAVPVKIPRPELYVVYTGEKKNIPDKLLLSQLYHGGGSVDLTVTVLRGGGSGNILDQYVRFCKITDEERKKRGNGQDTVNAVLARCREEGILTPFLASRAKEVHDIMVTLFNEEQIAEFHDYNIRKAARNEGRREGRIEGRREGRIEGRHEGRIEGRHEGRIEGRREGRIEGRREALLEGIRVFVNTLQDLSIDRSTVTRKLMEQYDLNEDAARGTVDKYWRS